MHDEPWAHVHDPDEERLAKLTIELNNPDHDYYHYEVIELTTVGIDIGSSTSHLMFSSITLQRVQEMHSSRYVVVDRQTLYKSPILLTPYTHDNLINTEQLERFVAESYAEAGFEPQDVDSGAIILTGEAIKRRNAHAIADIFADQAGKFVCASAGPQPGVRARGQRVGLGETVAQPAPDRAERRHRRRHDEVRARARRTHPAHRRPQRRRTARRHG